MFAFHRGRTRNAFTDNRLTTSAGPQITVVIFSAFVPVVALGIKDRAINHFAFLAIVLGARVLVIEVQGRTFEALPTLAEITLCTCILVFNAGETIGLIGITAEGLAFFTAAYILRTFFGC